MRIQVAAVSALIIAGSTGWSTDVFATDGGGGVPPPVCRDVRKTCQAARYDMVRKNGTQCGGNFCIDLGQAPDAPELECVASLGALDCDVHPKGTQLTYSYGAVAGLTPVDGGPTGSDFVTYRCESAGTERVVRVTAWNPLGLGASADILLSCPVTASPQIAGPSRVEAGHSLGLAWTGHPEAVEYELTRSLNGGAWEIVYRGAGLSWSEAAVPSIATYRVRACSVFGCGSYSTEHSVNTSLSLY